MWKKRILAVMLIIIMCLASINHNCNDVFAVTQVEKALSFGNEISDYLNDDIYAENKYIFSVPKAGRVSITVTVLDFHDCHVSILDNSNESLWDTYSDEGKKDYKVDLLAGQYSIVISHDNGGGMYKILATYEDAHETFADNGENLMYNSPVIGIGETVYMGQLASNDKKDLYKFSMDRTKKICVGFTVTNFYDCKVSVLNESGEGIWGEYLGEGINQRTVELDKGDYYLCVSIDNGTGNYSFFLDYFSEKYCKHNFEKKLVMSSYTQNGYTLYVCKECGKKYKANYTDKKVLSRGYIGSYGLLPGKKKIIVSYQAISDVSGYQIRYSTSKKFNKSVKIVKAGKNTTVKTLKKLKKRKRYYVQVRGYKKVEGKTMYGKWSMKRSVKTR